MVSDRYVDMIIKLDQRLLSELKSYIQPTTVIYDVMKATLVMVGDDRKKMPVCKQQLYTQWFRINQLYENIIC